MLRKTLVSLTLVSLLIFSLSVITGAQSDEVLETDVVVIGGGGAGLSAAVEAANHGAEVVLLEKMPFLGGETGISGGTIQGAETSVQSEAGVADSRQALFKYWRQAAHHENEADIVRTVANNSAATIDWLIDLGVNYEPAGLGGGGWTDVLRAHRPPGRGNELISVLKEAANNVGVNILMETEGTELIEENGRIVGVKSRGQVSQVNAKAVIIATGGFAANDQMINEIIPEYSDTYSVTIAGNTGDGIRMGEEIGAETRGPWGVIGWRTAQKADWGTKVESLSREVLLYVNEKGKRFTNEDAYYALLGEDIMEQEKVYQIFDETVRQEKTVGWEEDFQEAVDEGIIVKGETISELARKLELPEDDFTNTMEVYNSNVERGHDPIQWRDADTLVKMDQPPYYALEVAHANLGTIGGLAIDTNSRVLNTDNEPIAGLYAAGSVTGGFLGEVYPAGGTAISMGITTGRIAGQNAAAE